MSVFLYEEMLSVGLTLALIASLLLCQLTTQNADFAAVPARFWSNTFFTHQLLQFFLSPGLQEKNLLWIPWMKLLVCLNCG